MPSTLRRVCVALVAVLLLALVWRLAVVHSEVSECVSSNSTFTIACGPRGATGLSAVDRWIDRLVGGGTYHWVGHRSCMPSPAPADHEVAIFLRDAESSGVLASLRESLEPVLQSNGWVLGSPSGSGLLLEFDEGISDEEALESIQCRLTTLQVTSAKIVLRKNGRSVDFP